MFQTKELIPAKKWKLPVNKIVDRIITNLAIGLGLALIIISVFLSIDQYQVNQRKEVVEKNTSNNVQLDTKDLLLNYNKLSLLKNNQKNKVTVTIPRDSSGLIVAEILERKGLMTAKNFIRYMLMFDIEERIRAGTFHFSKEDTNVDILEKILINRR